jgi:hypothetical protein
MFGTLVADIRHSIRRLTKRPGYALLAVLTLALGVSGTSATYGIARGVLFDGLPYVNAPEAPPSGRRPTGPRRSFCSSAGVSRDFATSRSTVSAI